MSAPLALTLGEPAGIGPDITLAAWHRRAEFGLPPFYVVADAVFLANLAERLRLPVRMRSVEPEAAAAAFASALPVVSLGMQVTAQPGRPDASSAPAAIASIRRAVADVMAGRAAALVTNPVAKAVLYQTGFPAPGHTEYLALLAQQATGRPTRTAMMLWSPELAVVPVTIHLPLREVPGRLNSALIVDIARIVARDLEARFGIARPRLAIAGLNPHAGEAGALAADVMFHAVARSTYDVALCMYHDQALIPIKTLAFADAVNVTLGLPFVRTSPDHGTAFDIAGTGQADPSSLIAALRLAARIASGASAAAASGR